MTSCLVTRTRVLLRLDDGRQFELRRGSAGPPGPVVAALRRLLELDEINVDLSIP